MRNGSVAELRIDLKAAVMGALWIACVALSVGAAETHAADRASGADYVDVWGPALDSPLPLLDAIDQDGQPRNLADLSGDQGLLLFLVRSADW